MSTSTALTGRCLCGAIRYRAGTPISPATYCHCESCRRAAGSHVVAWITVPVGTMQFTAGTPSLVESSAGVRRAFCGRCGSPLTYWNSSRADEIDVTIGTLDDPSPHAPADHIWMQDAPAWDLPRDGLPVYRQARDTP